MKKVLLGMVVLFCFAISALAQDRTITGKVTSEEDGSTLPGVNVVVKGTTNGTVTDADGAYSLSVPQGATTLVFSFIGLQSKEVEIGGRSTIDVGMALDVTQLSEVVVTALGVSREAKTLPYASQQIKSENLNITQSTDIKSALSGKVAGVQLNGQAGSKLGQFGKVRIRGAISLTKDEDPLYVVDGIPTPDPNDIDMNNVESVNVLKGPNATALYGQRAEFGVIVITTKKGAKNGGLSVELQNSTTWDKVSYLPEYQNLYGGGYEGDDSFDFFDFGSDSYPAEWSVFDGKRYLLFDNNYADESWGPKFDGQDYVPWYAWWPDSPYFGQTAKYEAQPDNVRDFYQTGVTMKNTVSVSGSGSNYSARVSYSKLDQTGITPFTDYKKHFLLANLSFNATEKLSLTTNLRYTTSRIKGDYDDGYGNQTSGSFSSWFNRQLDTNKLRELSDLQTPDGYSASWNWWGPDYYLSGGGFKKAAFWFNPYTFMENYKQYRNNDNLAGSLSAAYQITEDLSVSITATRNQTEYKLDWYLPFYLSNSSAPELYNAWSNSFGKYRRSEIENNYSFSVNYGKKFQDFDVKAFVGGNIRKNSYRRLSAQMDPGAKTGGLIIPDVYTFSNAGIVPVPSSYEWDKQVNSIYGNLSVGYKGIVFLDASYRKDWSSALPSNRNGYGYPSIGTSFIFSELISGFNALSFGKLRGSWAQVGSDVDALAINPVYPTGSQPFDGKILMSNPTQLVDPNIKPSLNTSIEAGLDLRFIEDRIGASFTYYNEKRQDEIIPVSIPQASGYSTFLTNAGASRRKGIEIAIDADVIRQGNSGLTWNVLFNFARNRTTVEELPGDLTAINGVGGSSGSGNSNTGAFGFISVINELGNNWGQLRGTKIARDENGEAIIQANGLYKTVTDQYYGSILPNYSGGIVNRLAYKGIQLVVSIDYQKGGKFFSLSEQWGTSSGLMAETASINDNGMNVRDDIGEGGGVHVTGVDENGAPVDTYVDAHNYYSQWYSNRLAEPFVHNADYIKLREISLSYDFTRLLHINFIKGATIGIVSRNVALLAVAKDNKNKWDPSVLSTNYGEDGQLPNTRSYGVNINLTF